MFLNILIIFSLIECLCQPWTAPNRFILTGNHCGSVSYIFLPIKTLFAIVFLAIFARSEVPKTFEEQIGWNPSVNRMKSTIFWIYQIFQRISYDLPLKSLLGSHPERKQQENLSQIMFLLIKNVGNTSTMVPYQYESFWRCLRPV